MNSPSLLKFFEKALAFVCVVRGYCVSVVTETKKHKPRFHCDRLISFATVSLIVGLLFFGAFLIWPMWQTFRGAMVGRDGEFTASYIIEVLSHPVYLEGLLNSLSLAITSTLLSLVIALPLAWLADRYDFPGKAIFGALILVPMILPPFVGAIGIRQMLGQYGAVNSLLIHLGILTNGETIDWMGSGRYWGIVIMNALHFYPILYLNLLAALSNLDPAMDEAAENLGCTGWRKAWRITFPLLMPGLFAGGTIVFIGAFTELGVPLMFDYSRVTSVQIFAGISDIGSSPFPYALVVVMTLVATGLYGLGRLAYSRGNREMMSKAVPAGRSRNCSFFGGLLCMLAFSCVTFLAILPHAGVVAVSLAREWYGTVFPSVWTAEHYRIALGHELTVPAIANSLKYAGLASVLDLIVGVALALVIVRSKIPGRQLLDLLSMMPLAVPGLVLAFGYLAMAQEGKFFDFLNPLKDPLPLLVIAYGVRRLPYIVRSASAGLEQTSVTLEEAAQNLGATPLRTLRKITVPLIAANLFGGMLLVFSFAMLEVSDSLLLAQKQQDFPITKAIYELFGLLGEGRFVASALGVWAMVFLGVTLFAASRAMGKRLGALFRM